MKKLTNSIALSLAFLLLCSCGAPATTSSSANSTAGAVPSETTGKWTVAMSTDDFGDVTEDSDVVLATSVSGDFSNTATPSSDLIANVFFRRNPNNEHYLMEFQLLEYNSTPATYLTGTPIVLKTKINDTVTEIQLTGTAPNGDLFAGMGESDYNGDVFFNDLYAGEDIRCIVSIDSSDYNFTIESDNFKDICTQNDFEPGTCAMTLTEATKTYLDSFSAGVWGTAANTEAEATFVNNREKMQQLNDDQLNELLGYTYFHVSAVFLYGWMEEFTTDYIRKTTINFNESSLVQGAYEVNPSTLDSQLSLTISNDHLISKEALRDGEYEVRELVDGVYILYEFNDNGDPCFGQYPNPTRGFKTYGVLLFRWDEPIQNSDDLANMITTLKEKLTA